MLSFELCTNLEEPEMAWNWIPVNENDYKNFNHFLSSNNYVKSLKRDATALLLVGVKNSNGYFISKETKRYWLQKIN